TEQALLAALDDLDEDIRLTAGLALGERGLESLLELACKTRDSSRAAVARAAVQPMLSFERAEKFLANALREYRTAAAQEGLEAIGRSRHKGAVTVLRRALESGPEPVAVAAAKALGSTNDPAAETPLITALAHRFDGVAEAAAAALGRIGTAAAVLPLQEAA